MVGERRSLLLGCNAPRAANTGMAGTLLAEGAALSDRGWEVSYAFADPHAPLPPRVDRQLTYLRMARIASQLRPDVAVISSGDGALIPHLARSVPLVVQSHGLEHLHRIECLAAGVEKDHFGRGHRWLREPAVAHAIRRAAAVAVKNGREARYVCDRFGIPGERVALIPNGVEPLFLETPRRPATEPTIVWIGSWVPRKGIAGLPSLLESVVREAPNVRLHLVGCGRSEDRVRAAFPDPLQGHLVVTPVTDRAGVADACSRAWIGLSTSHFEGFGKNVIEMLAAGLPVVATPAGVAADVIVDDVTGLLVDHDSGRMSSAVLRLLREADTRRRMGLAARDLARGYLWGEVGRQWSDLLEGVIAETSRGSVSRRRASAR